MSEINLPWLDPYDEHAPFPAPESALNDPEGLVAAGGDLNPTRVMRAYHGGLFPWYEEGQPILWWSPNPRGILYPKNFIAHKSLLRTLKNNCWRISFNESFRDVMTACAEPRNNSRGTWITNDMLQAYTQLHKLKYAHSLEVWDESNSLIGGIYGISIGTIFFGESMFSRTADASKIALLYLSAYLDTWGYEMIDTQLPSEHLTFLGGNEITREQYLTTLSQLTQQSHHSDAWEKEFPLDVQSWLKKR